MKSKKVLHIEEAFFNLPDDFDGTIKDALMLMADRIVTSEPHNTYYENEDYDIYQRLKSKDNIRRTMRFKIYDVD